MQTHLDIIFLCVTQVRAYYIFVCNISMDKKYLIPYSCVTNVQTLHIYFIIRIFNGCELRIENSVTTVTVQHREVCVFRVTTPKKLGRVGRDFFFNKCGLFCKRHLSMTLRKAYSDTKMFPPPIWSNSNNDSLDRLELLLNMSTQNSFHKLSQKQERDKPAYYKYNCDCIL